MTDRAPPTAADVAARLRRPPPDLLAAARGQPLSDDEPRYRPIDLPLMRRLFRQLAPYRWQYVLGIGLGIVMVGLEMTSPLFIKAIVDWTTGFAQGRLTPMPSMSAALGHVAAIIATWAAVLLAAVFIQRTTILIMTNAGERVQFDLRRGIFRRLQQLSMSYYDRTKLGRIISRCTSDIGAVRDVNVWGIDRVIKNFLKMGVAAAMLLRTDPRLFWSVAWLGVVLFISNEIYRKKAGLMAQIAREGWTRVSTNLAENITGVRVVAAFNRQSPNLGMFNTLQVANTYNNVEAARINGIYQPLLQLIGFVGRAIILLYGGYLVATGRIGGVGAVVAAALYWDWFMDPITDIGNFAQQLMMALASAERIFSLLDTQPEVQDLPDAQPLPAISGQVTFDHVTFGYNPQRPVLHDITFEARPGQTIALVGATGSGKTSIISLIARFYQPQQGRILVDGHDIRHVTGDSLHRQTGLVLQVNYLFSGSVMENIRYARPAATDEQVIAAAQSIGSHESILALAHGYQSEVGERGANLSLGQRQLVCFTRAFLADPRIFMLDEATSSVDSTTEQLVQSSLEKLLAGRTTFIVAHRLSTIMRADCILVIDAGRIIERGTHQELLATGGKYAHLYRQFVQANP